MQFLLHLIQIIL